MISTYNLKNVAASMGWQVVGDLPEKCSAIEWDSRVALEGALYVALKGERFDGHDFCAAAAQSGAIALVVETQVESSLPQIVVEDSLVALGHLAAANRALFEGTLVALTGSAGKTSTKTILHTLFSSVAPSYATLANFNNEVGVPKTLLALERSHRYATVEMGAAKQGDIAYLCQFVQPNVSLVTLAAEAHVQGFGSLQGVADGKGEIFSALENGVAVVNYDSPFYSQWCEMASGNRTISFGFDENADVCATNVALSVKESQFQLQLFGQVFDVTLPLPGKHNVANLLAASACAYAAGLTADQIVAAIPLIKGAPSRMEFKPATTGFTVIDDSYNANPLAFQKAIDVLAQASGQQVLVMGDMGELDPLQENAQHTEVGLYAKEKGISQLFTVGRLAAAASEAFGGKHFESQERLVEEVRQTMNVGDTVLVKGSRSAKMDKVVAMLCASTKHEPKQREITC